ncbi:hypothetical protein, partial [Runella defluvii]|uniref:hypothetical protein n=1 Tax=Runella defluvii TaxID=370973 RepID=UPI001C847645
MLLTSSLRLSRGFEKPRAGIAVVVSVLRNRNHGVWVSLVSQNQSERLLTTSLKLSGCFEQPRAGLQQS